MIKEIFAREILDPIISSCFDPQPISFKAKDESGVAPVRAACRMPGGEIYRLKKLLNRNPFLCGCLDFTEDEGVEHLIIGLGRKHGTTTKIELIGHVVGAAGQVNFTEPLQQAVHKHIASDHRAEALIFHNHPQNAINVLTDNSPFASSTDRNTLLGYYLKPLNAIKTLMNGGRVRCYLGENGFVREFCTPNVLDLFARMQRMTANRQ